MVYTKMFLLASLLLVNSLSAMNPVEPGILIHIGKANVGKLELGGDCIDFKNGVANLAEIKGYTVSCDNLHVTSDANIESNTMVFIKDSSFGNKLSLQALHAVFVNTTINKLCIKQSLRFLKQIISLKKCTVNADIDFEKSHTEAKVKLILDKDSVFNGKVGDQIEIVREPNR